MGALARRAAGESNSPALFRRKCQGLAIVWTGGYFFDTYEYENGAKIRYRRSVVLISRLVNDEMRILVRELL